jgi:hypothetical protein
VNHSVRILSYVLLKLKVAAHLSTDVALFVKDFARKVKIKVQFEK